MNLRVDWDKFEIGFMVFFIVAIVSALGIGINDIFSQMKCDAYISNTLNSKGITVKNNGIIDSPPLVIRAASFAEFQATCKRLNSTTVYYYVAHGQSATFTYYGYYLFNRGFQIAYVYFSDVNLWNGEWPTDSG